MFKSIGDKYQGTFEIPTCVNLSVLPKLHYKHSPNWPELSKKLSEGLMLSENGRRTL